MPALATVPDSDTSNGLNMSLLASMISKPGKPPPVELGLTGLEMKARKVSPLLLFPLLLLLLYPPHEIRPVQSTMDTKKEKDFFNPGTPRSLVD
jgi:hypothetical protein